MVAAMIARSVLGPLSGYENSALTELWRNAPLLRQLAQALARQEPPLCLQKISGSEERAQGPLEREIEPEHVTSTDDFDWGVPTPSMVAAAKLHATLVAATCEPKLLPISQHKPAWDLDHIERVTKAIATGG
jgi:hypothetical protein